MTSFSCFQEIVRAMAANGLALMWYSLGHRANTTLPVTANGYTCLLLADTGPQKGWTRSAG